MTFQTLFGLSVLGSIVTVIGSLIALFLKEVLIARTFERWKNKNTLETVYRRYQIPIFFAAQELSNRLSVLASDNDTGERSCSLDLISIKPKRNTTSIVDHHYFRYRFISTLYRFCSLLGWLELYRLDIGTLDVKELDKNHKLEECLHFIRSALADGTINEHANWADWRDCLLFREELRAIGHCMIVDQIKLCLQDFGAFSMAIEKDPKGENDARWFVQAAHFFENLADKGDFRLVRMKMLVYHLTDLMELLQPGRTKREYVQKAREWRETFDAAAGGTDWRAA